MLQNAYSFAKIGADTVENERNYEIFKFAKNWQQPYGSDGTSAAVAGGGEEELRACCAAYARLRRLLAGRARRAQDHRAALHGPRAPDVTLQ